MKKLQDRRGETLIETLAALLIATFVLLFLATAVATAFRLNARVRDTDTAFRYDAEAGSTASVQIWSKDTGIQYDAVAIEDYESENGYHYYSAAD